MVIHHVVVSKEKSNTIAKEKVSDKREGYTNLGGWQRYQNFDDMKEAVVKICKKYLDKFEGQYIE